MPKKLIVDIYSGYNEMLDMANEPGVEQTPAPDANAQPAEMAAPEAPAEGAV